MRKIFRGSGILVASPFRMILGGMISCAIALSSGQHAFALEGAPLSAESFAALPALDVEAEKKDPAKVGDRIELRVHGVPDISAGGAHGDPSGWKFELPAGSSPLSDQGWAVLSGVAGSQADAGGSDQPREALRFTVVPLKAGDLILPSLALEDSEGKAFARTNPFKLNVASAIRPDDPKPQEPVALRPPVSLRFPWWVIGAAGILALLVIGAAVFGLMRWSRRNRKVEAIPAPAPPALPEDEIALLALEELEKQGAAKRGDYKKHFFRVSEVLKAYVGARYGFDALESTSGEIIQALESKLASRRRLEVPSELGMGLGMPQTSPENLVGKLDEIFGRLDLVKFTDHVPGVDESVAILGEARAFVLTTRRAKQGIQAKQGAQTDAVR